MKAEEMLAELEEGQEKLKTEIPEEIKKFKEFGEQVMEEGALSKKQKALIALGASLTKQCKYCIVKNLQEAVEAGADRKEIMEACGVIMLLNGGPGVAYSSYLIKKYEELTE